MKDSGFLITIGIAASPLLILGGCVEKPASGTGSVMSSETEEDCPTDVTYKLVAKPFLNEYCRGCHSEKVANADAPEVPHMFDSEADVRAAGEHVYEAIEAKSMPPSEAADDLPVPTSKERRAMLEWLECSGAREGSHAGH